MKRVLENEAAEVDGAFSPQLKRQRPFIGAMREVMGVQYMQRNLTKLEPFLRRVVQEEVGSALCRFIASSPRLPINRIQAGVSRRYRLHFEKSLPHTLFTGSRIEAEGRVPVQIVIMDTDLNKKITLGPLSSAKVEIVVLDGDFGTDDQMEWTEKEFGDSVVREREGKRPLLTGELVITLNNGVGCLVDAAFTDNSSWIRSRKFRLGARIIQNRCTEVSIQEAISGAFVVKDHRGELYRKHHPPSFDDEVWRLEKIGKDGAFHRRLAENGIDTVQDFLRNLVIDQERLRTLLGGGMSNKIWEATIEHAKECVLDDKNYIYCSEEGALLLFNSIFQLVGAMFGQNLYPLDGLTASQKIQVNKLKQLAYKNPERIIELNPVTEMSLPQSVPTSNIISVPQASCSEPQNMHLPLPSRGESDSRAGIIRQQPPPCSELFDSLQVKDYLTGQGLHPFQQLAPLQPSSFNTRDSLETYGDFSTAGLAGAGISGDNLAGYRSEIDELDSFSPLPMWDHGNGLVHTSGAESSSGGLVPYANGVARSRISSGKWGKLVAALKLTAVSKNLSANRVADLSLPAIKSSISNAHGGWFNDEG